MGVVTIAPATKSKLQWTELTSAKDLNNITKSGFYYWGSNAPSNIPIKPTGAAAYYAGMIVIGSNSELAPGTVAQLCYQIVFCFQSNSTAGQYIIMRSARGSAGWRDWATITL